MDLLDSLGFGGDNVTYLFITWDGRSVDKRLPATFREIGGPMAEIKK